MKRNWRAVLGGAFAAGTLALACAVAQVPSAGAGRRDPVRPPGSGASAQPVAAVGSSSASDAVVELKAAPETTPLRGSRAEAADFVRVQQKLAEFSSIEVTSPSYDLHVPPAARPLLRALKQRGGDVIRARLSELFATARGEVSRDELTEAVMEPFRQEKAAVENAKQVFGTLEWLDVRKVAGHERLYAAILSLGLPCGSDSTLFLYRQSGTELEHVLMAATHDYASIDKGQLGLEYAVSPPDERGNFYVVTAHATPWCSSAWRGFEYRALEPSRSPERPRMLLSVSDSVWIGDQSLAKLDLHRDGFAIEFSSWAKLSGQVVRTHVHAYTRRGARFERTAPWVRDPKDLPEHWLALDWTQAQQLVVPKRRQALAAAHARWRSGAKDEMGGLTLEQASKASAALRFECDHCEKLPKSARFLLEKHGKGWLLAGVTEG